MDDKTAARALARPAEGTVRPLRVLVVARQPVLRAGLSGLLADRGDIVVVGQSSSLHEAEQVSTELEPEALLIGWEAGDSDEPARLAEAVASVRAPIVLVGAAPTPTALSAMLAAGVRGFLLPEVNGDAIAASLYTASFGLVVLDRALAPRVAAHTASAEFSTDEPLTEREREVLQLLALGLPNKTIASRLQISEHTVKFHVGSILAKLDSASRTEAVTRAARRGLLAL